MPKYECEHLLPQPSFSLEFQQPQYSPSLTEEATSLLPISVTHCVLPFELHIKNFRDIFIAQLFPKLGVTSWETALGVRSSFHCQN